MNTTNDPDATFKDWDEEEHDKSTSRRTLILTFLILAIILAGLFAWRASRTGSAEAPPPQATQVAAMIVEPRDAPVSLEGVGSLSAVREVMLAPEVSGRVSAIRFDAGEYVSEGELLVQLYDAPLRADLEAARARADFARLQVQRSEELAPTGAEPRELLEERRSQLQQAEAEIAQLEARIRQLQVRAPFAGRLGIRQVDPGQYLNAGEPIATLTALGTLYVDFTVPQQELRLLEPGRTVRVETDAYPDTSFTARVSSIEPQVDEDTRNVRVQARLSNPDHALRPGMYVTASLVLPPQEGAIVVPATAIQTSAQGNSVIVIRGENARQQGQAEIVPVQTGRRIGELTIVESGIAAGDVIITEGQLRVQPGAPVQVAELAQPETL
ncbi:efflux RND transporter periplasmic adaptor subunit [Aurantiacibacter poecillastricola]|uniref:efflux RND transporter periplasmic adaptor subunit n=1 Tax=Aurantiacibacter poecillastricola TaxID=3064385 RepID=UPI00273F1F26|nr:efflux RND transporter periplasmic adaptor subunit [Aurantiacibacter sp. 219JJ12-13]MDP5263321.1 efflux RND transporter periplasmic adaptor subunit [Aurantiacibacter sp. 219JJ12-13]